MGVWKKTLEPCPAELTDFLSLSLILSFQAFVATGTNLSLQFFPANLHGDQRQVPTREYVDFERETGKVGQVQDIHPTPQTQQHTQTHISLCCSSLVAKVIQSELQQTDWQQWKQIFWWMCPNFILNHPNSWQNLSFQHQMDSKTSLFSHVL